MLVNHEIGQPIERPAVSGHDGTTGRSCRGGDEQVMRSTWSTAPPHLGEQLGMRLGGGRVVRNDGHRRQDLVDEPCA